MFGRVAANILSPEVNYPREPCSGSEGVFLGNPVRISCSLLPGRSSCSLLSSVMTFLRKAAALVLLSTVALLSDSPADYVPVSAVPARLGLTRQPCLRLVLLPAPPADAPPQVLDHAQDLTAQQSHVEPASLGRHQVPHLLPTQSPHLPAQALPVSLPRPRDLPGLQPVAAPRQHQVPPRRATQPYLPPAGQPRDSPHRYAAPAAPHPAGQLLPLAQVVPRCLLRPAHAAAQVSTRPDLHQDQARAVQTPPYQLLSLPASPSLWILPARSVTKVASYLCTAPRYSHVSAASTRPSCPHTRSDSAPPLSHHHQSSHRLPSGRVGG